MVTWSLAVEEQFYLLAPMAIRWIPVRRLVWLLVAVICAAPVMRFAIHSYLPRFYYLAGFAMLACRADALAFGILAAEQMAATKFRQILETRRDVGLGRFFHRVCVFVAGLGSDICQTCAARNLYRGLQRACSLLYADLIHAASGSLSNRQLGAVLLSA